MHLLVETLDRPVRGESPVPGRTRGVRHCPRRPSARLVRALASPKSLVVGADAVFSAYGLRTFVVRDRIAVSLRRLQQRSTEVLGDRSMRCFSRCNPARPDGSPLHADASRLHDFQRLLATPERALWFPPTADGGACP